MPTSCAKAKTDVKEHKKLKIHLKTLETNCQCGTPNSRGKRRTNATMNKTISNRQTTNPLTNHLSRRSSLAKSSTKEPSATT